MGAWGFQFTENDGALDFLGEIGDSRDWSDVEACLTDYTDNGGYDDADQAFAASELVAAALSNPSPHLDAELAAWAAEHAERAAAFVAKAKQAADLIASASELNELWAETDEYADWQASVDDLERRLG